MTAAKKTRNWHLWPIAFGATIGLVILRVAGVIDWAWYWLISPLWGLLAVALVVFALIGLLVSLAEALKRDS